MCVRCFFFTTVAGRVFDQLCLLFFLPLFLVYNGVWHTRNGPGLAGFFIYLHACMVRADTGWMGWEGVALLRCYSLRCGGLIKVCRANFWALRW